MILRKIAGRVYHIAPLGLPRTDRLELPASPDAKVAQSAVFQKVGAAIPNGDWAVLLQTWRRGSETGSRV